MREQKCNVHCYFLIRLPRHGATPPPSLLGLINSLAKLVQVNPLPSFFIYELRPLAILGNQSLIQLRIVGHPTLLTDDVGDYLALRFENFLNLSARLKGEVLAFDNEGGFCELMEGRG